jgi:hypothetical protein
MTLPQLKTKIIDKENKATIKNCKPHEDITHPK